MKYTVKKVAEISNLSIRALHHYDKIGLLKPEKVLESGYRNYSDSDIEKLQQILFFRELEFSLKEIKLILENPIFDRKKALITQREFLIEKKNKINKLINSIDKTINVIKGDLTMTNKELFEGFDDEKLKEYQKEAKERWSEKYYESQNKMAKYTKDDYDKIKLDQSNSVKKMALLMVDKKPSDPEVQALIKDNFDYINNTFYKCPPEIFKGLGQMYVDDERFKKYYENEKEGLAEFMRDSMAIFAESY